MYNYSRRTRHAVGRHGREQDASPPRPYGAPSSPCGPDAPLTREQGIEAESSTDVQDEEDPEGYGFGV
jgi:hypothetical protein